MDEDIVEVVEVPEEVLDEEQQPKTIVPELNFTASSPYYQSFRDHELKNLRTLMDTLTEISNRSKTFTQTGALMAQAMSRLAASCKLQSQDGELDNVNGSETPQEIRERKEKAYQIRRDAIGEEMANLLEHLGTVRGRVVVYSRQSPACAPMTDSHTDIHLFRCSRPRRRRK